MKFKEAVKRFWERIARNKHEQDHYIIDGQKFDSRVKAENASDKKGE